MMTRVDKRTARRAYDNGETIHLEPSKVFTINYFLKSSWLVDFDTLVKMFMTYNCDEKRGKKVHYYI